MTEQTTQAPNPIDTFATTPIDPSLKACLALLAHAEERVAQNPDSGVPARAFLGLSTAVRALIQTQSQVLESLRLLAMLEVERAEKQAAAAPQAVEPETSQAAAAPQAVEPETSQAAAAPQAVEPEASQAAAAPQAVEPEAALLP